MAAGEQVTAVSRRAADVPGARAFAADLTPVLTEIRSSGVDRVVLLSSQGAGTGHHPSALEDAVRASGLGWTILRPGGFHSNALRWAESVRARREVAAPFGDVALPTIDPADIAEVAAVALRDPAHAGKVHELTGPEPVSPGAQVAAIAAAVGEPVRFVEATRAEAKAAMLRFMPEPVVDNTLDILSSPAMRQVSPVVADLLGRPGRLFAEWAANNAQAFT